MALHQAQDLVAAKYKLVSKLPVAEHSYIVDMVYGGNRNVGISVRGTPEPIQFFNFNVMSKILHENTDSKISARNLSTDGCYLGFRLKAHANYKTYGVLHGTKDSVYISGIQVWDTQNTPIKYLDQVWPHAGMQIPNPTWTDQEFMTVNTQNTPRTPLLDLVKVWPHAGSGGNQEFSPQGIVACRSGAILICLWNNKAGEQSLGKVVSNETFEIFMDKNQPLFVCPTYIAENGNGDICVSDVGAVVVTDAGGMLRFRYQATSPNFEPYGLCCDSSSNIIIADMKNDRIHVIDKDGGFLYYVMYEGIKMPRALCIDEDDNVYVGEWNIDSIKVLSYKK